MTATESMIKKLSPSNIRLSPKMRWLVDSATGFKNVKQEGL